MNQLQNKIFCGGNLEVVSSWPSNFISAIVTDAPYELGFMGKGWDSSGIAYNVPMWKQMLRITKPGGFLLCFGGTRTYHRLACAIEDAGWEIRDCMMWLYGSGFPKSHNISKAIDKAKGAVRKEGGLRTDGRGKWELKCQRERGNGDTGIGHADGSKQQYHETTSATDLAQLWDGYGTALKPAWEPILVCMKPLDGTFAHNAETHQVAGLNIDGGRISYQGETPNMGGRKNAKMGGEGYGFKIEGRPDKPNTQGRWPANLILDEEAGAMLDEQAGTKKSGFMATGTKRQMSDNPNKNTYGKFNPDTVANDTYGDSGGASRFFYCAKTSRRERNMGMEDCEDKLLARSGGAQGAENRGEKEYLQKSIGLNRVAVVKNNHPTVKPLALMKYLCTLLKMPSADQIILDPFLGSGTTGMACKELGINFIGIEKEQEYCEIAVKRIAAVPGQKITLHTETTLPVTKNVETFRTTKDFAGGSRRPNENLPHISESRQRIINAASAALRKK